MGSTKTLSCIWLYTSRALCTLSASVWLPQKEYVMWIRPSPSARASAGSIIARHSTIANSFFMFASSFLIFTLLLVIRLTNRLTIR